MPRLSAPTRNTFSIAIVAIVVGIILWMDVLDLGVDPEIAYWTTTGGAVLLLIGNVFNKL